MNETPLGIYKKFFPHFTPSVYQQDLMSEINDLDRWSETLKFWAGNGYRPQSIQKMLDYYASLGTKNSWASVGQDRGMAVIPDPCICGKDVCFELHRPN